MRVYFFAFLAVVCLPLVAASLTCTWNATGCGNDTRVLGVQNSTGGFLRNSQAQLPENQTYAGGICCSTGNVTLETTCGTPFLRLSNASNAHVQQTNYSAYPYEACLSAPVGLFACTYADDACPVDFTCVASIASSGPTNTTNAHLGECSVYTRKVCCSANLPPTHSLPWLNATDEPLNRTNAALVATNQSTIDVNDDPVTNIYSFFVNEEPLALLLAPFDTSGVTGEGSLRDYARGNNGTPSGSTWTSGVFGGAYAFDGSNDYVRFPHTSYLAYEGQASTILFWARPTDTEENGTLLAKVWNNGTGEENASNEFIEINYAVRITNATNSTGNLTVVLGGNETYNASEVPLALNTWSHLSIVLESTTVLLYVNATLVLNETHSITNWAPQAASMDVPLVLGTEYPFRDAWSGNESESFNGTLDDLRIYNRTLSAEQITQFFEETRDSIDNSTIMPQETQKGELWWADVTPNDGLQDGETLRSNNVTIENSPPNTVELLLPANNTTIIERYPTFTWNTTDNDSDVITSSWTLFNPAGCAAIPTVNTTFLTYTSIDRLCVDAAYNWTVVACDSDAACAENTSNFTFTINSTVGVTLVQPTVDFGTMTPSTPDFNSTNSTLDNDPVPLRYNNTGNVDISVWTRAGAPLWDTQPLNTTFFQYADQGSASWISFTESYVLVYPFLEVTLLRDLEINVTVPQGEPATAKNASVLVMGVLAE